MRFLSFWQPFALWLVICSNAFHATSFSFPNEHIYLGYRSDLDPEIFGGGFSAKIPVNSSTAYVDGWRESSPGQWSNVLAGFSLIIATYTDDNLSGIRVTGPKLELYDQTFFCNNATDNYKCAENSEVVFDVRFTDKGVAVNGFAVPSDSDAAECDSWNEGGCKVHMGGSHYWKYLGDRGNWNQVMPLFLIYNKYGDKNLRSMVLPFGNFGSAHGYFSPAANPRFPSPQFLPGFPVPAVGIGSLGVGIGLDFSGVALSARTFCNAFCDDSDCLRSLDNARDPGQSAMHIMLYNPADESQMGTCQKQWHECSKCACCGNPASVSGGGSSCPTDLWMPSTNMSGSDGVGTETNTNECIKLFARVKGMCYLDRPFSSNPGDDCCVPLVSYHNMGCGCSDSVKFVAGPLLFLDLNTRLKLMCDPLEATPDPTREECRGMRVQNAGCDISDSRLEEERIANIMELGETLRCAVEKTTCFETKIFHKRLAELTDDAPVTYYDSYSGRQKTQTGPILQVPWGGGNFVGVDDIAEYVSISIPSVNHGMWLPNMNAGSYIEVVPNSAGSTITLINDIAGSMGGIDYTSDKKMITKYEYRECSTKFHKMYLVPNDGFAHVVELFYQMATKFKRYGAEDICRYHEKYCLGPNRQFSGGYDECMAFMLSLPPFTETCTDQRPLGGNSLGCRFKHHFMIPQNPDFHCVHIGYNGGPDANGNTKCADTAECANEIDLSAYPLNLSASELVTRTAWHSNQAWWEEPYPCISHSLDISEGCNYRLFKNDDVNTSTASLPLWARIVELVIGTIFVLSLLVSYAHYRMLRRTLFLTSNEKDHSTELPVELPLLLMENARLSRNIAPSELNRNEDTVFESRLLAIGGCKLTGIRGESGEYFYSSLSCVIICS